MHAHSIKDLLDLPELFIHSTKKIDGQIFIDAEPAASHQPCPVCASSQTIRRGINSIRKVRHLDSFGCVVYLNLPAIRLSCLVILIVLRRKNATQKLLKILYQSR